MRKGCNLTIAQANILGSSYTADKLVVKEKLIVQPCASLLVQGDAAFSSTVMMASLDVSGVISVDTINEHTPNHGVIIDGVLAKDSNILASVVRATGGIFTDTISENTLGNGVIIAGTMLKNSDICTFGTLYINNILEKTLDNGVVIEGVTLKDGMISVPTPGVAACIQDNDLSTLVCANNDDSVTMMLGFVPNCFRVGAGTTNINLGYQSFQSNVIGTNNMAFGSNALQNNVYGSNNTAFGYRAGVALTNGGFNTIMGSSTTISPLINNSCIFGYGATANASFSVAVGSNAASAGSSGIAIGNSATSVQSDCISIGRATIATVASAIAIGAGGVANAVQTMAFGPSATANALQAMSFGPNSTATGTAAIALGNVANARAPNCISMGNGAGTPLNNAAIEVIAIGTNTLNDPVSSGATGCVGIGTRALTHNTTGVNTAVGFLAGSNCANNKYITGNASQSGTTITGVGTVWTSAMQGGVIVFGAGVPAPLTTFVSATSFTTTISQSIVVSGYAIYYGTLYNAGTVTQFGNSVFGSGVTFTTAMIGGWLVYTTFQTYTAVRITAFQNSTTLTVDLPQTIVAGTSYYIYYTSSSQNTFVGYQAGVGSILGSQNTIVGHGANTSVPTASGASVLGYNAIGASSATAVGINASASGGSATAVGINTSASGTRSLALGYQANASGLSAIAIGQNAITLHDGIAIGVSSFADDNVTVIAIGYQSSATEDQSLALGTLATASGYVSTAISFGSIAAARTSIAMGRQAAATAESAIAIGPFSASSGNDSIAMGTNAIATPLDTIAIGHNAMSKASRCISMGGSAGAAFSTAGEVVAIGYTALTNGILSSTATGCIGIGSQALIANTTGVNLAIGYKAGSNIANNSYAVGTASQSATTITGVSTTWTSAMQGGVIVFANGTSAPLTTFVSSTSFTSATSQTVASQAYAIYYGTLYNTGTVTQSTTTVTGTGTTFTSAMVGGWLVYATAQTFTAVRITAFSNATTLTVNQSQTVASTSYYIFYTTSTQNTFVGYQAGLGNIFGSQNTIVGHGADTSVSTSGSIVVGYNSTTTANNAIVMGQSASNTVANSAVIAPNGTEAIRIMDPSVGNFSYRTVAASISGTTPTPTEAQLVGGYIKLSGAAGVTLTIGTGGVTGTSLSDYAQIAGNAYVGLTFKCIVVGTGAATNITISGTANTASNGITPRGVLTSATLQSRELTFINTGANTWDMIVV